MSTKQDKFYETLRQTQVNTFGDGLNMDLHPLSTPNTILTDCVNGTMITYNDNEFILQNDRGNTRIDGAQLTEGFIPVAMTEYNGILYIVSYNPKDKKTEIGTYPSPKKITSADLNIFNNEKESSIESNYTDYSQEITFYDYKLLVSNYDRYQLSINPSNPLLVLEHFILDTQGNITKVVLVPSDDDTYRFTHVGEGVLGYRYRPYFISSVMPSIISPKGSEWAKLVISTTSDDDVLLDNKVKDIQFTYDISMFLLSDSEPEIEVDLANILKHGTSLSLDVNAWEQTYNLSSTDKIDLMFNTRFKINDEIYVYDFKSGTIVNESDKEIKYNKVKFIIKPKLWKQGTDYVIYMDHLFTEFEIYPSQVFAKESWFSKFQYKLSSSQEEDNSDECLLDFNIELDLMKYDINWQDYTDVDKQDASFKLHFINDNGSVIGTDIFTAHKYVPTYDIIYDTLPDNSEPDFKLTIEDDIIRYKGSYKWLPVNIGKGECKNLTIGPESKPKYVQYVKEDAKTYNIVLLDEHYKIMSNVNIYDNLFGSENCINDMEEHFHNDGKIQYIASNIRLKKNKIYLFELTYSLNNKSENQWKIEKSSFIVITTEKMLTDLAKWETTNRMDELSLDEWFSPEYSVSAPIMGNKIDTTPELTGKYKNNTIDLSKLTDDKSEDDVKNYAFQFFLQYNSLFNSINDSLVPSIAQTIPVITKFTQNSGFNCGLELSGVNQSLLADNGKLVDVAIPYSKTWSLDPAEHEEMAQTVERKYLWDLFKKDVWKINLESDGAYNLGDGILAWGSRGGIIHLLSPKGYYLTKSFTTETEFSEYLTNLDLYITEKDSIKKRKGRCGATSTGKTLDVYASYREHSYARPWYKVYSVEKFNITAHLMHSIGQTFGMNFSKVIAKNYVEYVAKNDLKLWIHGKLNNIYYLVGIDALNNELDSQRAYNAILRHAYYLNPVNKTVYQYKYKSNSDENEDGITIISSSPSLHTSVSGKLYPMQCMFIHNDNSKYNVQSLNNLNYLNSQNIELKFNDLDDTAFGNLNLNYQKFLKYLGFLLNNYRITADVLNQPNYSNLYFDYIEDPEMFNISVEPKNMSALASPNTLYDRENKIIYTDKINEDNINQFEYTGGDCVAPLKWNYSLTFEEFWPITLEGIKDLLKYYSLPFYRYSSFNLKDALEDANNPPL